MGDDDPSRGTGRVMYGFAGATVMMAVLSTVRIVRTGYEGAGVAGRDCYPTGWRPRRQAGSGRGTLRSDRDFDLRSAHHDHRQR